MSHGRSGERTVWVEDDHLEPEPDDEEIPIVIICKEDEGGDDPSAAGARRPVEVRRKPGAKAHAGAALDGDEDEFYEDDIDEELLLGRIEDDLDLELAKELSDAHRVYRVRPRVAMGAGALLVAGILLTLTIVGWKYYGLTPVARYFDPFHDALRPSGSIGLTLGVAGTLLMAASLIIYLLRKRFAAWHVPGTVRDWLDLHVLAGLVGPAFIVFHSAFAPTSALGVLGLGSMCIILLSGAAGRWIHSHVPRSLGGHELEFEVIRRRLVVYQKKLIELGVDPELLSAAPPVKRKRRSPFLIESIIKVIWGDRQSRRAYSRLRDAVRERADDWESMERVLLLAWKLCMEQQALARYRELRKVVGTWRFFHRWFAIVLFVAIAYHAAVALRFGDLWGE